MTLSRRIYSAVSITALTLITIAAQAQARPNLSDITGPIISPPVTNPGGNPGTPGGNPGGNPGTPGGNPSNPNPNLSDITGPNPNNPNPNLSDITGTDVAGARASRAASAGFNDEGIDQLSTDLGNAYDVCASGGDCTNFYSLLETAQSILQTE